jgi:hypothetical protein
MQKEKSDDGGRVCREEMMAEKGAMIREKKINERTAEETSITGGRGRVTTSAVLPCREKKELQSESHMASWAITGRTQTPAFHRRHLK